MRSNWLKWSVLPAAFLLAGGAAMAQDQSSSGSPSSSSKSGSSTTPTPKKPEPTIAERKESQQDRIATGVESGQRAGEGAKLRKQQQGIHKQVAADRKANGGKLDASQKQQINRQQNAASRNIYRKKHNRKTEPGASKP